MLTHVSTYERDDFSLHAGILASVVVHIIFIVGLFSASNIAPPPQERIIDVSIEPPRPKQPSSSHAQKQLVAPSAQTQQNIPPQQTNRESDTDSQVIKEQIKRGMDNSGPAAGKQSQQPAPAAPPQPKSQPQPPEPAKVNKPSKQEAGHKAPPAPHHAPAVEKAPPPKLEESEAPAAPILKPSDLKLDSSTLFKDFGSNRSANSAKGGNTSSQPFSRPQGSGAMFVGMAGSSDYLPNLPDGDITLLNAKANQFAVFVRRVAIQVFTQIRSLGWENLTAQDVNNIARDSMVEAVMSPKGDLLRVTLTNSSQSRSFDDLIVKSAKNGSHDPNPPEGAKASDGNVHFIFRSRSWSEIAPGRGGIQTERRWLLLETGLE